MSLLLFLVFLVDSDTAVDPAGLKLRITDKAFNILKDISLAYLKTLEGKTFSNIRGDNFKIKWFKLTSILVNPAELELHFRATSGVVLNVRNMEFIGKLRREIDYVFRDTRTVDFRVRIVNFMIDVSLNANQQGRLRAHIVACQFRAGIWKLESSGILGWLWDSFRGTIENILIEKVCPLLQETVIPNVNSMLESLSMYKKIEDNYNFIIDYSLSKNIEVMSSSLDVSFKGLIFRQGESVTISSIKPGTDPIFNENNFTAYVGISEFLFNSAAMSLYKLGPFLIEVPETGLIGNFVLDWINLPKGPIEVHLTEAPTIRISKDGLLVTVEASAQSLAERNRNPFHVSCVLPMKVDFEGCGLVLVSRKPQCKIKSASVFNFLVEEGLKYKISEFLDSWFLEGVFLPLPEGLNFKEGMILYYDGFLVAGGNLNFIHGRDYSSLHKFIVNRPVTSSTCHKM